MQASDRQAQPVTLKESGNSGGAEDREACCGIKQVRDPNIHRWIHLRKLLFRWIRAISTRHSDLKWEVEPAHKFYEIMHLRTFPGPGPKSKYLAVRWQQLCLAIRNLTGRCTLKFLRLICVHMFFHLVLPFLRVPTPGSRRKTEIIFKAMLHRQCWVQKLSDRYFTYVTPSLTRKRLNKSPQHQYTNILQDD